MGRWGWVRACAGLVVGGLACAAFYDAATLHGGYELLARGTKGVPVDELAFVVWYVLWGSAAAAAFGYAVFHGPSGWLSRCAERVLGGRERTVAVLCFAVFLGALLFRHAVLLDQPVTDDESAYELNARLLTLGHVTVPPSVPAEFLQNQFVVTDATRFHGKYPMGHSLLLAPFELIGRADLLGPLLAALSMALTYAVGRRFVGARLAVVACVVLACSPHFVWTHGTLLSQTSSLACMLAAALCRLRFAESGRAKDALALGALLGFGLLVRPLPLGLVAVVLVADVLHDAFRRGGVGPALRDASWLAPGLALFVGALLACNLAQSGSPLSSGYAEVHGSYGALKNQSGELSNSVGGALVRENLWLLGWPFSLAALPFARPRLRAGLFWCAIATTIAYRLLVPKTVVATTGPVYLTEVVPWLCVGTASGLTTLRELLTLLEVEHAGRRVLSVCAGAVVAALLCFVPVALRSVHTGAEVRAALGTLIADTGHERVLVFANLAVLPGQTRTWAYYPANPWPDLRDDVLFLRLPEGAEGIWRAWSLWRTRFPDRPAYLFDPTQGNPNLVALSAGVEPPHAAP